MKLSVMILFISVVNFAQTSLQKGKIAFEQDDFQEAISMLTIASENHALDTTAKDYLGQSYAQLELWDKSAQVYQNLVEEYPEDAGYHFRYGAALGFVAKNSNKFKAFTLLDDVKYHLKKAIELNPKHIEARWALLQMYLQLPVIVGGSESKSREYASQLKSISPVDAALAYGYIERELENFDLAEMHYKKAVDLGQSITTYKEMAELYKCSQNEKEFFQTLEAGIEKLNSIALASVYVDRALTLNRNKQKAKEILNTLELAELNSEEKQKLNQLKSQLD